MRPYDFAGNLTADSMMNSLGARCTRPDDANQFIKCHGADKGRMQCAPTV